MMNPNDEMKRLSLWLLSFLVVAIAMYFYFHAPLLPIVLAGVLTFMITLLRGRWKK